MERYNKVNGSIGLVKDSRTHAILNTDSEKIRQAKAIKQARKKQVNEIEDLKRDVNDIKLMLNQIVDKLNGA